MSMVNSKKTMYVCMYVYIYIHDCIYLLCVHVETENKDFSDLIKLEKDGHEKSWNVFD